MTKSRLWWRQSASGQSVVLPGVSSVSLRFALVLGVLPSTPVILWAGLWPGLALATALGLAVFCRATRPPLVVDVSLGAVRVHRLLAPTIVLSNVQGVTLTWRVRSGGIFTPELQLPDRVVSIGRSAFPLDAKRMATRDQRALAAVLDALRRLGAAVAAPPFSAVEQQRPAG